jgi:hypothetical protein
MVVSTCGLEYTPHWRWPSHEGSGSWTEEPFPESQTKASHAMCVTRDYIDDTQRESQSTRNTYDCRRWHKESLCALLGPDWLVLHFIAEDYRRGTWTTSYTCYKFASMLYFKTMVQDRHSIVLWNIMTLSDGCLLVQNRTSRNRASPLWTWSMLNASPLRRTMTCIKVSQHEDIHSSSALLYVAFLLHIHHATSFMHPAR